MSEVENTLRERGERYGKFSGHANIAQRLKDEMRLSRNWDSADCMEMRDSMREALDMIQHKIARILNGDPTYADSWHDIAGYAKLVEDELNGVDSNAARKEEVQSEYPRVSAKQAASLVILADGTCEMFDPDNYKYSPAPRIFIVDTTI